MKPQYALEQHSQVVAIWFVLEGWEVDCPDGAKLILLKEPGGKWVIEPRVRRLWADTPGEAQQLLMKSIMDRAVAKKDNIQKAIAEYELKVIGRNMHVPIAHTNLAG